MIGIHLQNSTSNWPLVANTVASGGYGAPKVTKILYGVERAREVNQGKVWYRWVGAQPLPYNNFEAHCEAWLRQFVDESFIKVADSVHFINGYNETLANSQSDAERARWVALHTAMAKVWYERFRMQDTRLRHIKLIMCETAVGNDIPLAIARASVDYDAVLGYHPYIACDDRGPAVPSTSDSGINRPPYVSPHDWRWYSGRWEWMDREYRNAGLRVKWAFGEMGPVLDASHNWSGWLDPIGGWRSCLGGSVDKYKKVMTYWLDNATLTKAYHEGRIVGGVLFTTGAPGDGQWDTFDIREGALENVINHTNNYPYPKMSGTFDPPPPPPPPAPDVPDGLPREQYAREYWVVPQGATKEQWLRVAEDAYESRRTIGFSYDDAGIGALSSKRAILYGIPQDKIGEYTAWFNKWYPGTTVVHRSMPNVGTGGGNSGTLAMPVAGEFPITQRFGENYDEYMSRYGIPGHNGMDIGTPVGTQVVAAAGGFVTRVGYDQQGYGHHVIISHSDSVETIYAHLNAAPNLRVGTLVAAGHVLGESGNSGWSTGPHLHFGVRVNGKFVDPEDWLP